MTDKPNHPSKPATESGEPRDDGYYKLTEKGLIGCELRERYNLSLEAAMGIAEYVIAYRRPSPPTEPQGERATVPKKFRIWSGEHLAWWRPEGHGYTQSVFEAGEYNGEEASEILRHAGPEKKLEAIEVLSAGGERVVKEGELDAAIERYKHAVLDLKKDCPRCDLGNKDYECNCFEILGKLEEAERAIHRAAGKETGRFLFLDK